MAIHEFKPSVYYNALGTYEPVLQIASEDTVITTTVQTDKLALAFDLVKHACKCRLTILAPHGRPHDKALLLPPVITKIYAVKITIQHGIKQFHMVRFDAVK